MTPPSREAVIVELITALKALCDVSRSVTADAVEIPRDEWHELMQRVYAVLDAPDLLALVQSDGWKPIAEAPKDGTRFIAWGPNVAVAECEYRAAWFSYPAGWYRTNQHPRVEITHWMPLPDPPRPQEPR